MTKEPTRVTENQFKRMRQIRKEINRLRSELNNLEMETRDNTVREAEEQLAGAVDVLDTIEEGDWL
jgi:hypothetical protein